MFHKVCNAKVGYDRFYCDAITVNANFVHSSLGDADALTLILVST